MALEPELLSPGVPQCVVSWPCALVRITNVLAIKSKTPRQITEHTPDLLSWNPWFYVWNQESESESLTSFWSDSYKLYFENHCTHLLTFHFYIHLSNQTKLLEVGDYVIYYFLNPKVFNKYLDIYSMPTQYLHFLCSQQN